MLPAKNIAIATKSRFLGAVSTANNNVKTADSAAANIIIPDMTGPYQDVIQRSETKSSGGQKYPGILVSKSPKIIAIHQPIMAAGKTMSQRNNSV